MNRSTLAVMHEAPWTSRWTSRWLALALLGLPLAATAQSGSAAANDPLAPFLGTWSGVFTTQDNEFWGVEDFVCFPGCPPEVRERMVELLDDPNNDRLPVGALMGNAMGYTAEHLASILTPIGRRIQEANDIAFDPKLHCQPYGYVREITNPLPMTIRRDGDNLMIMYEEWSQLRTIYMNGPPHRDYRTPTLLGYSVGRLENGTLVVETSHVTPDWFSDASHGGHSGELRGVERYTIRDDPRRLELELTLEDPVTLTQPYRVIKTWLFTPDVELVQDRCGAFPGKF